MARERCPATVEVTEGSIHHMMFPVDRCLGVAFQEPQEVLPTEVQVDDQEPTTGCK